MIAALGLRLRPEVDFTRILNLGQAGKSGETYAFNRDGLLLSQSRFDDDLMQLGLLADLPGSRSTLTISIRDPEVDIAEGKRPAKKRADQPLTFAAAEATAGRTGLSIDGYRDYRGTQVVGAWTWLEEYDFGVITEIEAAEAFKPLVILRSTFLVLFGLLIASAIAIFVFLVIVARQKRAMQVAALTAKELGQYALEEKLGEGGMGAVYKARHKLMRRPTAVKLLHPEKVSDAALARFEREVQLTSQLNHHNTIAIYDYGRTPEGVFYYAMEYLDGINLEDLVSKYGSLPESRVIDILRQVCGSLNEAHGLGLVHRDIKPANIVLNVRGGIFDFIKVLDFGLVKALDENSRLLLVDGNPGLSRFDARRDLHGPFKDAARDAIATAWPPDIARTRSHPFEVPGEGSFRPIRGYANAWRRLARMLRRSKLDAHRSVGLVACVSRRARSARRLSRTGPRNSLASRSHGRFRR